MSDEETIVKDEVKTQKNINLDGLYRDEVKLTNDSLNNNIKFLLETNDAFRDLTEKHKEVSRIVAAFEQITKATFLNLDEIKSDFIERGGSKYSPMAIPSLNGTFSDEERRNAKLSLEKEAQKIEMQVKIAGCLSEYLKIIIKS